MCGGRGLEQGCGCSQEAERQARMIHLRERLPMDRKGLQDPLRKAEFAEGSGEQRGAGVGRGSQQEDKGCKQGKSPRCHPRSQ